jgi:hypothetical protein
MAAYEKPTQASMLGMFDAILHSGDQFRSLVSNC